VPDLDEEPRDLN